MTPQWYYIQLSPQMLQLRDAALTNAHWTQQFDDISSSNPREMFRIDQSTRYLHVHALWNLHEKQHFSDIAWIDPQEVQLSCDLAFRRQCATSLLKELALRVPGETWRFNDFAFRSEPETPCLGDVALRKPIWLLEKSVCPFEDPAWLSKGWFGGWRIHLSFNSRLDHRKSHPTDGKWMWAPQMTFDFWKSKLVIADK